MREKDSCSNATRSVEERNIARADARDDSVPTGEVNNRGRLGDAHGTHNHQINLVSDTIIHVETVR